MMEDRSTREKVVEFVKMTIVSALIGGGIAFAAATMIGG